ncbi:zinc-binding dehydrogenase [Streptomyces sp. NPDC003006]
MFAVTVTRFDPERPLSGLEMGQRPDPVAPGPGWDTVRVSAAALNHHDLWTLRGVGIHPGRRRPLVLGSDGAGYDEHGNPVIIHCVIGESGHGVAPGERPSVLAEKYDGTFAERVTVPRWNLLPMPPELSFEEAACLPGAYLTAYRMLMVESGAWPGGTVLVQGAGGGVATALVVLGRAAGLRVWVTSRSVARRDQALQLGADAAFEAGAKLPAPVDAVMETVGAATWRHSIDSLRPGGTLVVSGATSGAELPDLGLDRIVAEELRVLGATLGTRRQLTDLIAFCGAAKVRPIIGSVLPLEQARTGFEQMAGGGLWGKVVFTVGRGHGRPVQSS